MEHWHSALLPSLANSLGLGHSVLDSHTVLSSYWGQSIFMFYCSAPTFLSTCPAYSDSSKTGTTFFLRQALLSVPLYFCSRLARSRYFTDTWVNNHNHLHLYLNSFLDIWSSPQNSQTQRPLPFAQRFSKNVYLRIGQLSHAWKEALKQKQVCSSERIMSTFNCKR